MRGPRRSKWLVLGALVAGASLGACGEPISDDELRRGVESLESYAHTGELLADEVAADRTKTTFARALAREMAERADHEAEKLADATGVDAQRERAVAIAQRISDAYGVLQVETQEEVVAARVEHDFRRYARQALELRGEL